MEKYGINYGKDIFKKVATKLGVENVSQLSSVKQKIKNTCLEKWGVESINQVQEIKDKKVKSNLENHWVSSYLKTEHAREKLKEKLATEGVKLKRTKTNLNKYWVANPFESEDIRKKALTTKLATKITEDYLTEEKLWYFLQECFPWFDIIRDRVILFISSKNKKCKKRPDYQLINREKNLYYIVEFDGYGHYMNFETIVRDFKNAVDYENYTATINIPYYIQLNPNVIDKLFWKLDWFINKFPEGYLHFPLWFISKSCKLPFEFIDEWKLKFIKELKETYSEYTNEIIESIKQHKKYRKNKEIAINWDKFIETTLNFWKI